MAQGNSLRSTQGHAMVQMLTSKLCLKDISGNLRAVEIWHALDQAPSTYTKSSFQETIVAFA